LFLGKAHMLMDYSTVVAVWEINEDCKIFFQTFYYRGEHIKYRFYIFKSIKPSSTFLFAAALEVFI
jgi:hypothetical protein